MSHEDMKLVFLDIDGVLNGMWTHESADDWRELNADRIHILNNLTGLNGVEVILSTSWRKLFSITEIYRELRSKGFIGQIGGATPGLDNKTRGDEVVAYLRTYPGRHMRGIASFVVLDDDEDFDNIPHRLVKTDPRYGLRQEDIMKALDILKQPFDPELEL